MSASELDFKIITVGDPNVGKTSIIKRFCENVFFQKVLPSRDMDYSKMTYKYQNDTITVHFWDTVGAERFRSLTRNYFRGAQGVFIVYDVTNEKSLIKLNQWFEDIEEMADKDVVKILVGNKCDVEESDRVVDSDEAKSVAEYFKIPFFEVSSKTNKNFDELMYTMISKISAVVRETNQSSSMRQDLVILSNNIPVVEVSSGCAC